MKGLLFFSFLPFIIFSTVLTSDKIVNDTIRNDNSGYSSLPTDSNKIKFIENYSQISSISELLDSFKDKPVFIDLWTTWCSPCLKEFEFNKPLFDYLDKNGIELVYVSFDKDSADNLWRTKINEHKLSGNHIRAGKLLQDSLTTLIWGGIDAFSIPRYLLFDKNKKLVNIDASLPSSGLKLFKEIEFDLKSR
jgi:thiol-disulfide isomerase/thioredoxin